MPHIQAYANNFFDEAGKVIIRSPAHQQWINVRDAMIVHTRGIVPKMLLETKRPNEPPDILKYRIGNYRPVTKAGINTGIDSVFRILMGSNFSIKKSPETEKFLTDKKFSFLDVDAPESIPFLDVFFRHLLRIDFDDPNGFLVWFPTNSQDPDLPPFLNERNEKIDVEPLVVDSEQIVDVQEDLMAFQDKELVEVGLSQHDTKLVPRFFILTPEAIWRLEPFAKGDDIEYRLELWYNMSLIETDAGEITLDISEERLFPGIPGRVLGGNLVFSELKKDKTWNNTTWKNKKSVTVKYFESFFAAYLPFADEALATFSDNQAVNVRYNFPYVSIKGQQCYTCNGAGKVPGKTKDGKKIICKTCNGKMVIPVMSPFAQYIKEPPTSKESEAFATSPVVEFATPDVGILKHSFDVWQRFIELAEEAISVKFTQVAQSAVAKDVDRERKFELLMNISNNLFSLIDWSLDIIEAYRQPFVSERKESIVKHPTSFSIKTVGALGVELTEQQKNSTPQSFIVETAKELAVKVFNEGDLNTRIVEILTAWDPLYGRTEAQLATLKATQAISTKDVTRTVKGYTILVQLSNEIDFFKIKTNDIIEQAEAKLDALVEEPIPLTNDNGE